MGAMTGVKPPAVASEWLVSEQGAINAQTLILVCNSGLEQLNWSISERLGNLKK